MNTQLKSVEDITLWCNRTTMNGKKLDDGSTITMNGSSAKLVIAFNELVDELNNSKNYNWTENHTDEDGRFEIADNKYQLTTSCYFAMQGKLKSFTLQLLLDDETLEPSGISIAMGNKCFSHKRHIIEAVYDGSVEDLAELVDNTLRVMLLEPEFKNLITKLDIKPSSIDTKWIERAYALTADGIATDVKVIGFKAASEKSMMVLSYKVNGVKKVSETSIAHYLHDYSLEQGEDSDTVYSDLDDVYSNGETL